MGWGTAHRPGCLLAGCLLISLVGCGPDSPSGDGGDRTTDGGEDQVATAPAIPWIEEGVPPIAIAPCSEGWREVTEEGTVTTCDPYPAGGALDCPDGQAHFPGEAGCAEVGSPCPAGDFSELLPSDRRVVYVRPGATDGDGSSEASPYGSLTEFSLGGLPTGTVIALSRGTHDGGVRLARGMSLWGACAAETRLVTTEPSESEGVVTIVGADVGLRDLTVADSPRPGLWLTVSDATVLLDGVVFTGVEQMAIYAANFARLEAHGLVVRGTRGRSRDLVFGRGLAFEYGASGDLARAVIEDNRDVGLFAGSVSTSVTLAEVVIRDTQAQALDGDHGIGLMANVGAAVAVSRTLIERNHDTGVFVDESGATATLTDVVVRDTQGRENDRFFGGGVMVQYGAAAALTRVLIDANRLSGVFVGLSGATATLSDVVVRDTLSEESDGLFGRGLNVQFDASAEVTRALFERNSDEGVYVVGAGASLTLTDVVARDTRSQEADSRFGRGLYVSAGATAEVSRALFDHNRDSGVIVAGEDVSATFVDVFVRDTESQESTGAFGRGIDVQEGAAVVLTRAILEGNREVGLFVGGSGTTLAAVDTVVRDTLASACTASGCPLGPGTNGVGIYRDAALSMTRFVVARAEVCGVHIAAGGQVDLSSGEVREHPIGVCQQVADYDLGRLMGDVRFIENGVNLDATTLPVPDPAIPDVATP